MTVYGRSDLCYVAISKDHGGCGEGHARPVVHGAPAAIWALTCHNGCEDFLRHDPLWSATAHGIPETPDEVVTREDVEKRGQIDQAASVAQALERLASLGDLPAALRDVLIGVLGAQQSKAVEPQARIIEERPAKALEDAAPADDPLEDPEPPETPADAFPELESMSMSDLKAIAEARGLKTARSKADQIAIILGDERE
jgi:hypothetical protein